MISQKLDMPQSISRRAAARRLAAAALVSVARPSPAQDTERYARLTARFEDALEVRTFAVQRIAEKPQDILEYVRLDYESRTTTLFVAERTGVFDSSDSAIRYVRSMPSILPEDFAVPFDDEASESQITVISELAANDLPIVPPGNAVTPVDIASIEPHDRVQDSARVQDSDLIVLGDILFSTLGIGLGTDSLILTVIKSDEEVERLMNELLAKLSTRSWDEVVELAETIFPVLVESNAWVNLRQQLGKRLARKITFRLALRCVPIVGWIYLAAAFFVSIRINYHRFSFA